ncbi:unnamed protein product [Blepharisma stoltei]|uniref:4-nitrophenylphosphatase n=1 Tax=Blepharisma stoltei TaxID=1481888 RepID=A0AAU9JYL3_9CILI|nr:unnamed protein product [Blepharisma stoltei]
MINDFDYFFFDVDGVLFHGHRALRGAVEFINKLCDLGKEIYFVSNNSWRTREKQVEFFAKYGITAKKENILNGAYASAQWATNYCPRNSKVLTIGEDGVDEELTEFGFRVTNTRSLNPPNYENLMLNIDPEIKAAIVSHSDSLTHQMIYYASIHVQNGAVLASPNYDTQYKFGKFLLPCAACTVDAVLASSGTKNFVNIGKPDPYLLNYIFERDRINKERSIFFGDTMVTDILLAKNAGIKSVLVLTGVETLDSYTKYDYSPDYVYESVGKFK